MFVIDTESKSKKGQNREGRPPSLRQLKTVSISISHPSSSFKKELTFGYILNKAVIFENISKFTLDRAKICSGEKVAVQKGAHFFSQMGKSTFFICRLLPFKTQLV